MTARENVRQCIDNRAKLDGITSDLGVMTQTRGVISVSDAYLSVHDTDRVNRFHMAGRIGLGRLKNFNGYDLRPLSGRTIFLPTHMAPVAVSGLVNFSV